jgi:23S rRNA pseudouridine1911/1915/1917 synthase
MKTLSKILVETIAPDNGADYSPSEWLLSEDEEGDANNAGNVSLPMHRIKLTGTHQGQRLDQVLALELPQHSRNRLQSWIKAGQVTVDGISIIEPKRKVQAEQTVVITELASVEQTAFQPENIPLDIVYEDAHILVLNKPAGLVVHPGSGNWSGTLLNALLFHYPASAKIPRAGIVHRLDKETTGLMVVAKTLLAQTELVRQLQVRSVKRHYLALAQGLIEKRGIVDEPIGRHPSQRIKMAVVPNGKPAITHYRVLDKFARWTLVECSLETGRTHQIRVHMAHIGFPLVGDPVYGKPQRGGLDFARQALHATRLGLIHPVSGESMLWFAELPADMVELLEQAHAASI